MSKCEIWPVCWANPQLPVSLQQVCLAYEGAPSRPENSLFHVIRDEEVYIVEWLIFLLVLFFPFFNKFFQMAINNTRKKTIQYMSLLTKHLNTEYPCPYPLIFLFGILELKST